ncbi:serine/threonine-protein kinase [Streptosporangium lutulentum]|uniref:serine/threonine-protein kinase n=1 Tax=Streptosporangium lutulentum TaxID=1461250 RepID=UPI003643D5FB
MAETGAIAVPGYEVSGVLGQGGFGIVYRARQLAVEREVALKVDNRVLVSERDRRRFMREVTAAGALSGHPHVAHVYDAGVLPDGRPYMVLELCPGGSLSDRMRAERQLPAAEVADIGIRIADALAAAHDAGVLHRDIKPANILINRYGNVVLADFGLAAMSASGAEVSVTRESLTPAYAPPEAFELTEPSAAGDVYSLAATLYALLSGRPPRFPEGGVVNIAVVMALHRLPIPDIPGVPPELTDLLRQAMVTDPGQRTPSAAMVRDALTDLRLDHGAPASRSSRRSVPLPPPASPLAGAPSSYGTPPIRPAADGEQARAHPTSPGLRRVASTQPPAGAAVAQDSTNTRVFVATTAAFLILLVAGVGLMFLENGPNLFGPPPPPPPWSQGEAPRNAGAGNGEVPARATEVLTVTAACPAAAVPGARAACVKEAECWSGLLDVMGDVTAKRIACEESHSWETYAIAPLPADSLTYDSRALEKHPTVKKVCAKSILLASRYGDARATASATWRSTVLPPSKEQFEGGTRTYRCLGGILGSEKPGIRFRP